MSDFPEWTEAKQHYDAHQYEDALTALQAHPQLDGSYFYNLGTLYLQMKKPGIAIAYLEKANRFQPHDSEIQHNLSMAQAELGKTIGYDQLDPASFGVERLADRIPTREAYAALSLLSFLLILLAIRTYLKTRNLKKFLSLPVTLTCLVGICLTTGIFLIHKWVDTHPPAVCLETLVIRSGPGDHYVQLGQIPEGTKVRILTPPQKNDSWQQIRYTQEGVGWVKTSGVLTL